MFLTLAPVHLRNIKISQKRTMSTLYNLEHYSLSSWWMFCTCFAVSSPPTMISYLDFQWKDLAKTSIVLIDSHFIKNNHLAIWPVLSNQEKQYNIKDSIYWARNICQALYFTYIISNPHNPANKYITEQQRDSDVLVKGHTVNKWWNRDSEPGLCDFKVQCSLHFTRLAS